MMNSTSTSSLHCFDSTKWRKRLHKISDKLQRSHHWNPRSPQSATVLAAATEKYAPTRSTEIAIHSEDLTASQFANLTGIKTNRNSLHSIYSSDDYADSDSEDESEDDYYMTTMASSSTSYNKPSMRIWDSHFWQDGRKRRLPTVTIAPLTKTHSLDRVSTAALSSQPLVRNKSEPVKSTCVQKGRFKIVWGQDDTNAEIKAPIPCVEWKRKRASSHSAAAAVIQPPSPH